MQRAVVIIALLAAVSAASQVSKSAVHVAIGLPSQCIDAHLSPPLSLQPFTDADRATIKKYLTGQTLTNL